MAVERTVNGNFVSTDRSQDLRFQPLPVQIAAGLGVARGGPLLRTKEEIVGMEQRRIGINRRQQLCQGAFAAGGAALNGQQDPGLFLQGPINGCQQRQQADISAVQNSVSWTVGGSIFIGMMAGGKTVFSPVIQLRIGLCRGIGQSAGVDQPPQDRQLFLQGIRIPMGHSGRPGKNASQRFRGQAVCLNAQLHPGPGTVQRFNLPAARSGFRSLPPDTLCGGGGVRDQMLAAKDALIEGFAQILKLGRGMPGILFQKELFGRRRTHKCLLA